MHIHKNARTTPRSRGQIVARVLTQRERPAAVAAAVGVRERTVRKWLARYTGEAAAGLADRSCRPRRRPVATPVARLSRQRWPGAQIAQALHRSASTVARILRRQGLARLRALEPPVPVQRYQLGLGQLQSIRRRHGHALWTAQAAPHGGARVSASWWGNGPPRL